MERKLTVVADVGADSVFRRMVMTAAAIVGFALLLGCSSNQCHRCRSQTTPTCHNRVCQQAVSSQIPVARANEVVAECPRVPVAMTAPVCEEVTESLTSTDEPDELDLTTKPVARQGFLDESEDSSDGQPLYGHGENYEWLIGVLHRVHIPRKGWKVRYARLDEQDRWGGSVVPAPDVRMEEFEDGTNVYVEGEVINNRASLYLSGPRYRITTIRRVTEGDARRVFKNR